jgi:putative glutamine amidotransferase
MPSHTPPLKIGVSACFFHSDPHRPIFTGKTLQYLEQSMAHWLMAHGAMPVMIPAPVVGHPHSPTEHDYAHWLDGLLLEGGSDVWPGSYRETPLDERWQGDRIRDEYEQRLLKAFVAHQKPVFGVCRGLQLINVAFGGTLYQDIPTQRPDALKHRDPVAYDQNFHEVRIEPQTRLAALIRDQAESNEHLLFKVNSVHHQAIKDLADDFLVEARCPHDQIIEAIRWQGDSYVAAVQWHPEFHRPEYGTLNDSALLSDFLSAATQQAAK